MDGFRPSIGHDLKTPLRVLVIDKSPHVCAIAKTVLDAVGAEVRACPDGATALTMLALWPAHAVIVDFEMAPMDGPAFTRAVRTGAEGVNRHMAILMMTAHGDYQRVMLAREAGVDGIVTKPLSSGAVLPRLRSTMERAELRRMETPGAGHGAQHCPASTDTSFGPDSAGQMEGSKS